MDDLRTIKGNITKEKILLSSLDIICSSGVEGLSASKIASKAGISKSSVFHHFGSINNIPFILMEDLGEKLLIELESSDFPNFYKYMEHLGAITFSLDSGFFKFFKALYSFYQNALHNKKFNEAMTLCTISFKQILIRLINRFYDVDDDKTDEISTLIYSTLDGMGMHFLLNSDEERFIKVWNRFLGLIIKDLEE